MDKLNYIVKRLLQMIPVLAIVIVLVFVLIRLIPGDPAMIMLGSKVKPEVLEGYRQRMGYYEPLPTQFLYFLRDLAHFDFGESVHFHMPVTEVIKSRFGVTFALTVFSSILTIIISLPLGYLAGMKQNKLPDQAVRAGTLLGMALPSFWIGLMLLMVFGVKLGWFPVSGYGASVSEHIRSLTLPSLTMAISASSVVIRNTRNNIADTKNQDYVFFARGKGLTSARISLAHIIRNAVIPTVTLLSMRIAYMFGGSVIIESVFSLPGMGELLLNSVLRRDYAVVQGAVITFVMIILLINLITDLLYSAVDPRISLR